MKIFNLSLHRSGTQSFHTFMLQNKFRSAHWPGGSGFAEQVADCIDPLNGPRIWNKLGDVVAAHDTFSDVPFCFLYREAFAAFPDAKFLMILRDWQVWAQSVRRHIGSRTLGNLERAQYYALSPLRHDHIFLYSDADLRGIYYKHLEMIVAFFGAAGGNLRLFSLNDRHLGRGLLEFIHAGADEFPSVDYLRAR